jgi:hypothetical protein
LITHLKKLHTFGSFIPFDQGNGERFDPISLWDSLVIGKEIPLKAFGKGEGYVKLVDKEMRDDCVRVVFEKVRKHGNESETK